MAWGNRAPTVWSPCELEWLKKNREERNLNECSLWLAKSRAAVKRKLDEFDGKVDTSNQKKRTNIGKRSDILVNGKPTFVRSGWEASILRWLTYFGKKWEYEPTVFHFQEVKHGTTSYCPDIKVEDGNDYYYIEVKGYLDSKGRAAINRFKKYYPLEFNRLKAITGGPTTKATKFFEKIGVPVIAYMKDLNREYKSIIPFWE